MEMTAEKYLKKTIAAIQPADQEAMRKARERQDYLAKVPGSLGRLEEISVRIAGMTGKVTGNSAKNQGIIVCCADNGVVAEGVASAPQSVTQMQTINFTRRITGMGSQAAYFGIDVLDIDVGVKLPIPPELYTEQMIDENGRIARLIVNRRILNGTRNLAQEPAMTREETLRAFAVGIEAAEAMKKAGKDIIGVGEMGIGNSTTGANLICAYTGADPVTAIGRGGGLSNDGLAKKARVVQDAVARYKSEDPVETARGMGGLDICAMAGAYLGAASLRMPAVVDGYISIAAALLAQALCPTVTDYLFTSHLSQEPGYQAAAKKLGIKPFFSLDMKLGEASGCPIAFQIIEAGLAVMNGMKTLAEASIDADYLDEFREEGLF